MTNKKMVFAVSGAAAILISILVISMVYPVIDSVSSPDLRTDSKYWQNIETPGKKILNGYLGVLYRFNYFGNINWLAVPLLIWFLVNVKRKERWQMALIVVWTLTFLFICLKGYTNYRYQLTLFPFTAAMTLLLLWKLLEDKKKAIKIVCLSIAALLCAFNIYHYFPQYKKWWEIRVSLKTPHFPHRLIDYLNSRGDLRKKRSVYTFDAPIFYYHTNLGGVNYTVDYAVPAWVEFSKAAGPREPLFEFLKNNLKIEYILLSQSYKQSKRLTMVEEFLECECRLFMEDNDWLLYELRDKPLEQEIKAFGRRQINRWDRTQSDVQTIAPVLTPIAQKGDFKIDAVKKKDGYVIVIRGAGAVKEEKTWIHLGYDLARLNIAPGDVENRYVSFIVKVAISPNLERGGNYAAILERNNDGTIYPRSAVFNTNSYRTYLVTSKIRPGLNQLTCTLSFSPRSKNDLMIIKDAKIIISGNYL